VFVYLVDTLRADALGAYGGPSGLSPGMDAFARDAVVYERAYAASTWTLPSVASLLTGTYADRHGLMMGDEILPPSFRPSLPTLLAERGYRTAFLTQSAVVGRENGLDAGFAAFFLENHLNVTGLGSQRVRTLLARWLAEPGPHGSPFAYVHTVDPHAPYSAGPPFDRFARASPGRLEPEAYHPSTFGAHPRSGDPAEVAHLRGLYLDEVAYADREFGRFLDLLRLFDLYERSLIVLVSDHGEEFREHGGFEHGRTLYEELVRVPLIVKYPGERWAGTRVARPVSVADVAPTVAELVSAPAEGFDGESLRPDRLERAAEARPVFFQVAPLAGPGHGMGAVDLVGAVQGSTKCIGNRTGKDAFGRAAPAWLAFDRDADPAERAPLAPSSEAAQACRALLERRREERASAASARAVDPEALERLRALGYAQ
jgi:arylsulfatase A-like enzyme